MDSIAVLPAFLVEIAFYLVPGFAAVRKAFDQLGSKSLRAVLLALSALLPYLIASLGTATFALSSFLMLLSVVLVASFWYALIRAGIVADLLFLALMAGGLFKQGFRSYLRQPVPACRARDIGPVDVDPRGFARRSLAPDHGRCSLRLPSIAE